MRIRIYAPRQGVASKLCSRSSIIETKRSDMEHERRMDKMYRGCIPLKASREGSIPHRGRHSQVTIGLAIWFVSRVSRGYHFQITAGARSERRLVAQHQVAPCSRILALSNEPRRTGFLFRRYGNEVIEPRADSADCTLHTTVPAPSV